MLEYYKSDEWNVIEMCNLLKTEGYIKLDPNSSGNKLITRWGIMDMINVKKAPYTIQVTVLQEQFWIGIFERNDDEGYAVAKQIFGNEPTDAELYQFVTENFQQLKFTKPQAFKLIIKRKNPKRLQREVRHLMEKAKTGLPSTTHAQEVLRLELEQNKKAKQSITRTEKLAQQQEKFLLKQEKKKKKQRGH